MRVKQISVALLSGVAIVLGGCKGKQAGQMPNEFDVLTLKGEERTFSMPRSASIKGRQDVDIYPQVSGKLIQLCVKEGERVKAGQVLFIVDQVPYRSALNTALANLEAAKAQLATAQLTYNSREELYKQKVVSEYDMRTAENTYLSAKAQVAQAEAAVVNARNNLSYTEIKSPVNGVVGTFPYRVGALVGASMPKPLTTVSDNSVMYVYFSITENQLLDLTRQWGSREEVLKNMPNVKLKLNDQSIYELEGKVETISGVIDPSTGTASLRAAFPNPNGVLYSGTSGNVIITEKKVGLVIPKSTTFEIQDKCYVYKIEGGKTHATIVSVEKVDNPQEFLVAEGLNEGDTILAEGVGTMREGTPITPKVHQKEGEVQPNASVKQ